MTVLDLFSGAAGGWSLGMHRAGFTTVAACEAVDWRRALYAENNPGIPIYEDVRGLTASRLLRDLGYLPDIVVGSPPCQDISSANTKGKGVEGERSGLFFEATRIIGEIRPRWFALENSHNLRTRGADAVLAELERLGYACWPLVVRASDIDANHERPRCWIIGCDLEQVAHADGHGRAAERRGWRGGIDVSVPHDTQHAARVGHEGRWSRGHGAHGDGTAYAGHAEEDGCGPGRNTPHPDQARQAHGCMEPGLRQAEIADDGCGDGRSDDGSRFGQVAICPPDRGDPDGSRADWSLADLAGRLWLDDGLPARVAGTRVAVGGPKGTLAASLIVEAYGDAVVPQIPEAIGRAILRVEAAMRTILSTQSDMFGAAA